MTGRGGFKKVYVLDPSGHRTKIICETLDPKAPQHLDTKAESSLAP